MFELYIATLASIFSVVNPLGAVPVYLAMTPEYTQKNEIEHQDLQVYTFSLF